MKKAKIIGCLLFSLFVLNGNAQIEYSISIQEVGNVFVLKGSIEDMNYKRLKRLEGSYQLIVDTIQQLVIPSDLGVQISKLQQLENDVTVKINDHLKLRIISLKKIHEHHPIATNQTILFNKEIFLKND